MRVRISYGIDLANAPVKTAELVDEAAKALASKLQMLEKGMFLLDDEKLISTAPQWLDEIRQGMAAIDQTLADAHAIVSGYLSVQNSPEENVAPQSAPPVPRPQAEEPADVHEG